jgi:hypothetical protein
VRVCRCWPNMACCSRNEGLALNSTVELSLCACIHADRRWENPLVMVTQLPPAVRTAFVRARGDGPSVGLAHLLRQPETPSWPPATPHASQPCLVASTPCAEPIWSGLSISIIAVKSNGGNRTDLQVQIATLGQQRLGRTDRASEISDCAMGWGQSGRLVSLVQAVEIKCTTRMQVTTN